MFIPSFLCIKDLEVTILVVDRVGLFLFSFLFLYMKTIVSFRPMFLFVAFGRVVNGGYVRVYTSPSHPFEFATYNYIFTWTDTINNVEEYFLATMHNLYYLNSAKGFYFLLMVKFYWQLYSLSRVKLGKFPWVRSSDLVAEKIMFI